jgi:hypothetical protein
VTASQIIEESKRLDPKEQIGVIRLAYQLDAERQLTGKELSWLAERMVNTTDPAEQARVREEIVRGFYGQDNMPKIRREHLPPGLFNHLPDRIVDRQISASQLEEFVDWPDTEPDVA